MWQRLTPILLVVTVLDCSMSNRSADRNVRPGLRMRFSRRGLDYANRLGQHILEEDIGKAHFPNITAKINDGPGHGVLKIGNLHVTHIIAPNFNYTLLPSSQSLEWYAQGGEVILKADWTAWYEVVAKLYFAGYVEAGAKDIDLFISATIRRNAKGLPQVEVRSCDANVSTINVRAGGSSIAWIVNMFRSTISHQLKQLLLANLCKSAEGVLLIEANTFLASLPQTVPLKDNFTINYSMTSDPRIETDYLQTELYTSITYAGDQSTIDQPSLPPPQDTEKMFAVWFTDYPINTMLDSAHRHGKLAFIAGKDTLPKKEADYLKVHDCLVCIGALLPEIGDIYTQPDAYVDVILMTLIAPQMQILPKLATITCKFSADFYIHPWNSTRTLLIRSHIDIDGNVTLKMRSRRVEGAAQFTSFSIRVTESYIGDTVTPDALQLLEEIFRPMLLTEINKYLKVGYAIPVINKVRVEQPQLILMNRALYLTTDLAFDGNLPYHILNSRENFFI